jgi:hypothetical protein
MFLKFLKLEWKAFTRSSSMGQEIAVKILLGFLGFYLIASCLVLGFTLYSMLSEYVADRSPIHAVNSILLVWVVMELFMRFFLQTLPTLNVKPFMVQPVKRTTVIHFVLIKSIFSFYNLLSLLVFVPFVFTCVKNGVLTTSQAIGWLGAILGILLSINFSNFLLKKKFADNVQQLLPYIFVAGVLAALEYFGVFSITRYVGRAMDYVLNYPALGLLPLGIGLSLYAWNYLTLKSKFYLDSSLKSKITEAKALNLSWLDRFGPLAPFIKLDIKLLWRNKRPKTTLYMAVFFLAYGLIFYTNEIYSGMPTWRIFLGIFMTGIFMINFGQFIPAWDSSYYPLMMSQNIPLKEYLKSKAALMYLSILILFLGTLPYAYFGIEIVFAHLAAAIYNAGINIPVLLFSGSFNKKRIDLEKSVFMNYQGTGAAQWLVGIPVLLVPIVIWYVIYTFSSQTTANLVLAGIGIIGIAFNSSVLGFITQAYRERKYEAINGFKQQDA